MNVAPRVGLAGWSEAVSRYRSRFPRITGTGLERYASALNLVEVNVSFYRQVRHSTYEGWAAQTPQDFAFSVKMSRSVTHFARLSGNAPLDPFWESVAGLGDKLKAVLVQLPPSLAFEAEHAAAFFARMRSAFEKTIAVEGRHTTWFGEDVRPLYDEFSLTEVATRIPEAPAEGAPAYYRLHGEPRRYRSPYSTEQLARLASDLSLRTADSLVIFDNTASSAGVDNALTLRDLLEPGAETTKND